MHAEDIAYENSEIWIESAAGQHHFVVEIANTHTQRQRGLMFRRELPRNTGMLFNFGKETRLAMWMKNTFIPLDMLFVNKHGTIHRIVENTTPLSLKTIPAGAPTMVVIEFNAGVTRQSGIRPGDRVIHKIFDVD
ncbi:MAG: DUF192 domain-containing protein [Alphaproteobacteria bacterium]